MLHISPRRLLCPQENASPNSRYSAKFGQQQDHALANGHGQDDYPEKSRSVQRPVTRAASAKAQQ
jgi:hypothetical protein